MKSEKLQKGLRVLHVSASYKPAYVYGGPVYSVSKLCAVQKANGMTVHVLTTTANGKDELFVDPGRTYATDNVDVRFMSRWTGDHTHFSPPLLWSLWKSCRHYDTVHIHSWWNLVSVGAAWVASLRGIKPIISLRGTLSGHTFAHGHRSGKVLMHRMIGRRLLSKSVLHATTEKEAMEIGERIPGSTVTIIPNILEFPTRALGKRAADGLLKLIFVGRIHPVKNLEILLDVIEQLRDQESIRLEIIGEGEQEYVQRLQERYPLRNIVWSGVVTGVEKFKRMAEADVLVLPSHTENFGNVVIEALSQGTPVVLSDQVGMQSYISARQAGWVFKDRDGLQSVLERILTHRESIAEHGERGAECVRQDFSMQHLVEQYCKMYAQE